MNSELKDYKSTGCCRIPGEVQINENTTQHSCCKLDSYNWLEDIDQIVGDKKFDCVEIRFKNSRKDFFKVPLGLILKRGDIVAVEASPGHDIGVVSLTGETARLQMIKKKRNPDAFDLKKVYRKARGNDIDKWMVARGKEQETMVRTRKIVGRLGLEMKINDVEFQGDGTKVIFYYTAEERVDFRLLIRELADAFFTRIEMKQIGVRQESGRLGGIGPCGRELCCSSWMSKFKSVSTTSARTQNLSLNPQKLAGQCGKLKCCLNFEQEAYVEELRTFPDTRSYLKTSSGDAFFRKMDILKGMLWYSYVDKPESFIPLLKEDVIEIQKMNKENSFPDSLEIFIEEEVEEVKFDNVIGQDDVSRFDHIKPKRSKGQNRNRKRNTNPRNRNKQGESRNNQNPRSSEKNSEGKEQNKKPNRPQRSRTDRFRGEKEEGKGNESNSKNKAPFSRRNQKRNPRNNQN